MSDQVQVWPEPKDMALPTLRLHALACHRLWVGDVKTANELRGAHATWHAAGFHTPRDGHTDHVHAPVGGLRVLGPGEASSAS